MFQFPDAAFDQMPFFVQIRVDDPLSPAIDLRRNNDLQILPAQKQHEFVRVITFIGDDVIGKQIFNQSFGLRYIIALTAR